jgi:nucleoside-diphosphate-sugar epimerase
MALADGLIGASHDVTLFDVTPPQRKVAARYVQGDLRDGAAVTRAMEGSDYVLHTAALHPGTLRSAPYSEQDLIDVNVGGTRNVLEAAVSCGVRRVVHSSTVGVLRMDDIDAGDRVRVLSEDDLDGLLYSEETCMQELARKRSSQRPQLEERLTAPVDGPPLYGITKALSEHAVAAFHSSSGLDVVALRYSVVWELAQQVLREQLVETALGPVTGLADVVASNIAAIREPDPLGRLAYPIWRQLVSRGELEAAGGDARAAIAAKHPGLVEALPASTAIPSVYFDTTETERDLGIALTGLADGFLREALREAERHA